MKIYLALCGAAALLTFSAATRPAGATPPPTLPTAVSLALTPDEQLFTGLLEQVGVTLSTGDITAFGKYLAPDYVHYNPDGGKGGRAEELAYLSSWKETSMKLVSPVKVMRQGNMAVTVATSTFSGVVEGKPFKNNIQMMIAWVLRNGQWQMAVVHSKEVKG